MSKEDPPEFQSKDVCEEKHKRVDEKLDCYEKDIRAINRKILATLIFTIIILVTLIIDLMKAGIHL